MIYKLPSRSNPDENYLEIVREEEKEITIRSVNKENESYIYLEQSELYDLIGVLTELRKRLLTSKKH